MLNKDGQRELAYVVKVDDIKPIEGKDRVECAIINGWTCMVPKNAFKSGNLGVYFEIDSKLDTSKPEFAFTEKYHGKIKTQKFSLKDANGNKVGTFFSQGLLMPLAELGLSNKSEGDFLTKELGVTYAEPDDNKRKNGKQNSNAKYQRMMNRHPKLAKSKFGKWCMKHSFTKKFLYFILGGDKKNGKKNFPNYVKITDEERYQNLSKEIYESYCKEQFYATEKIDGSSGTFTMKRNGKKEEYYVCSRTVVKDIKNPKGGYYDENIWAEVNEKYNMQQVCSDILYNDNTLDFITIQGEVYGNKVQKREYNLKDRDLAVFNVIFGYKDGNQKRLNPVEGKEFMDKYKVPFVPVLGLINLPENREELQITAHSDVSKIDGGMREGIVFRSIDGTKSFKAVDNEYLVKYHGEK